MNILFDLEVSHQSLTPLHTQLHQQIRDLILSGTYPPGSRLPSETQLQQHLCVSRNTIRQALHSIEAEGLIDRIPGKGTFIATLPTPNGKVDNSHTLYFITHNFENMPQRLLLAGAESVARSRGYRIVFTSSDHLSHEEIRLLDQVRDERAGGVLLWSMLDQHSNTEFVNFVNSQPFPCVMMDRTLPSIPCDYVTSANYEGGQAAVQHLIDLGHERIVFIGHQCIGLLPVAERLRAYRDTMRANGLTPLDPFLVGRRQYEMQAMDFALAYDNPRSSVMQAVVDYLSSEDITAVFAVHDYMALLVMKATKLAGLQVPRDLSIVGFDDVDMAAYLETPLTTVAQDTLAIGQRAASLLIDRIEGYAGPRRWEFIPTTLRVRASTAPPLDNDRLRR